LGKIRELEKEHVHAIVVSAGADIAASISEADIVVTCMSWLRGYIRFVRTYSSFAFHTMRSELVAF